MKSAVENLGPTRVKLTVEVGFDELSPSLDSAYRKVAQQIRIPGFRPGKVPPRIIDQRVGRAAVLEEAVNEAIPHFYGQAVDEADVRVLSQPEIEVTNFADGEQLTFTAEVDVRPTIELPDLENPQVGVDDVEVSDDEVEEQLKGLADRFATLSPVERGVEAGDFATIDLAISVDGEELEDGTASGLSYEVGSGDLVDGLDSALVGLSVGESAEFDAPLAGPYQGKTGRATVSVKAVRVKDVPALDDSFAQQASEFDTLEELRGDLRTRLERVRRMEQGLQARERLLENLIGQLDVPLPEAVVQAEVDSRAQSMQRQLAARGEDLAGYLEAQGETLEEHETHTKADAERDLVVQFVLDAVVSKEEIGLEEAELTDYLVRRAARYGISPDEYANQLVRNNSVPMVVADALRGKALALLLERATITDASGRQVDLKRLDEDAEAAGLTGRSG